MAFDANKTNALRAMLQKRLVEARLTVEAVDAIDNIESLGSAADATQARLDAVNAGLDKARAELATTQAMKERTVSDATTEAAKIIEQAQAHATSIKAQARDDVAAELADTNRELEAARQELAGLNDRIGKAHDALSA